MIRDIYDKIKDGIDVRSNLSQLRKKLKEPNNRHALLYCIGTDSSVFTELLGHADAKTRKNVALVLGELGRNEYLEPLYEAYERETTLFVKSAYLLAMKQLNYSEYVEQFKQRIEKLNEMDLKEEEKKHIQEEIRVLSSMIVDYEGIQPHSFRGYHEENQCVLLTNRNYMDVTLQQLNELDVDLMEAKTFNAGVLLKTNGLKEVMKIRTFQELLFMVPKMKVCKMDVQDAASTIVNADLLDFLSKRHKGKAPFYFRIEWKTKVDMEKRGIFTKKVASEIERLSKRQLINAPSNYEFEIRFIEAKDGRLNILVKLYTLLDDRFQYRKEVVATSIQPVNAALTVQLVKPYLKENGQVLDPFCGVGTMLIERHKQVKANTMYALDTFGQAIEKAKRNTLEAHQIIHYINRDFFDFKHEYLFDEIITDMPFVIQGQQNEHIYQIYYRFFDKARQHLKENGVIILYSHDADYVRKLAPMKGYRIREEFELNRRQGTYVFVLQ